MWCWNNSLRGYPKRQRSGSSATARRRWTWPSNSRRTRWRRATGLAKPCLPSLSLSPLCLLFLPLLFSLGPVLACYPGPSPDGGEDRHRSRWVYHPQTDGLVERFNRTLKTMIRKFVHEDAKNWDIWLEPLLFAVREVPQASTGFSPFELLYGRQPHGVLDVLRETWEEGPSGSKNEIQHVLDLRTKLHTLGQLSMENLLQAQDKQSRLYNRGTRLRNFAPGDKVLVLLPTSSSKLLAKWQGPFEVTRRVGDLNYEVLRTDRSGARQIYHLNLLKKWSEVEPVMLATTVSGEDDLGPEVITKIQSLTLAPGGDHLSPSQLTNVARLQKEFADVFSPLPGRTNLIQHHIETEPGVVVRSRPYRLPEHKKKVVQSELEAMLEMGVIEESHSDWASPIVLVPKTDGSVRFCVD